ncbi:LOW QUALITY PROTEIN: DDE_4 domain-containing protein, partial [Cephalotus follicularis]
ERFQHSGETISRNFKKILEKICLIAIDIMKPLDPYFKDIHEKIVNSKYMAHFKNSICVVDGVHVTASLPYEQQVPYIGRKGIPTQNIMAVCDFDMQFTFVYAGWQGTAHDTWIFYSTLRNLELNFPKPLEG